MAVLPLLLLAPLLLAVAYFDLRYMRIPNKIVLASVVLFVVTAPVVGWHEAGLRLLAAALVFAIGLVTFALRWFGGGDVKMLAALFLFIPSQTYAVFGMNFGASMLAGIAFILLLRRTPVIRDMDLVSMKEAGTFPMGISIAAAGLLHPFFLNALY